jgi:hypothetical protein
VSTFQNGANGCSQCDAGFYLELYSNNSFQCSKCPAGRFSKSGSSFCYDCPINQFSSNPGSSSCTSCPLRTATFGSTGLTSCSLVYCSSLPGLALAASVYKLNGTSFYPFMFLDGRQSSFFGAQSSCSRSLNGALLSTPGNLNWFNNYVKSFLSTRWIGYYQSYSGNWLTSTTVGWVDSSSPPWNVAGGYPTNSSSNIHCAYVNSSLWQDTSCSEARSYLCQISSRECLAAGFLCSSGQYFDVAETGSCVSCPAGFYQSRSALNYSCNPCDQGNFSPGGSSRCMNCAAGKYANASASANCTECPLNSFSNVAAATSVNGCQCNEGFYGRSFEGKDCLACSPVWHDCPSNSTQPFLKSGFFQKKNGDIVACDLEFACEYNGFDNFTRCASGYQGDLCSTCASNFYRSAGKCLRCGAESLKWVIFVVVILFFVYAILRIGEGINSLSTDFRIVLSWLQIVALFPTVSNFWPSSLLGFLRLTSIINVDFDFVSPGNSNFAVEFVLICLLSLRVLSKDGFLGEVEVENVNPLAISLCQLDFISCYCLR